MTRRTYIVKTAGLLLPVLVDNKLGLIFSIQPRNRWLKETGKIKGFFNFVGGELKKNESYFQAAVRETKEEFGLEPEIIKLEKYYWFDISTNRFESKKIESQVALPFPFLIVRDKSRPFLKFNKEIICYLFLAKFKKIPLYIPRESSGLIFLPLKYFLSDSKSSLSLEYLKSLGGIIKPENMLPSNILLEPLFNKEAIKKILKEREIFRLLKNNSQLVLENFLFREEEIIRFYPCDFKKLIGEDILKQKVKISQRAIYIHLPFCDKFCNFCSFNKIIPNSFIVERYLNNLEKEFRLYSRILNEEMKDKIEAVWIGGGTPFILSCQQLERLLKKLKEEFVLKNAEITIETTLAALEDKKINILSKLGIHRLSIGIQSFNNKYLKMLNRQNILQKQLNILEKLKKMNMEFNIDLIYRLPGETFKEWRTDLQKVVEVNPAHISCFSLVVNRTIPLWDKLENNLLPPYLSSIQDIEMYELTKNVLQKNGYVQYTINHFSKPGKESKYQILRFSAPQKEIIGLGAGSLSYFNGYAYFNFHNLENYCNRLEKDYSPVAMGKKVTLKDKMALYMVLGFRALKVPKKEFRKNFNLDINSVWGNELSILKNLNLISESKDYLELTTEGQHYINNVSRLFFSKSNKLIGQLNAQDIRRTEKVFSPSALVKKWKS